MKRIVALMLVLILALSCVSMIACGGGDDDEKTQEATKGDETSQVTPDKDTPDKDTPAGSGDAGEAFGFDSYDELDSYHMRMVMKSDIPMVGETEMTMDEDIDNKANASHSTMDMGMGMGNIETITIGSDTWTRGLLGNKWVHVSDDDSYQDDDMGFSDDFSDQFDFDNDLDYKGKEKVNGINCKHYEVDAAIKMDNPDPNTMVDEIESTFKGDIWVADESSLPEVPIRMIGTSTVAVQGMDMVMEIQQDVTRINESIKISAPPEDEVMDEFGGLGDIDPEDFDMDDLEGLLGDIDLDFQMPE